MGQALRQGMIELSFKFLTRKRDRHGTWRWWVRQGGKWRMIPADAGDPGSEAFHDAYWDARRRLDAPAPKARQGASAAVPGSLRWLCTQYCRSGDFKRLGADTRKKRKAILDRICQGDDGRDGNLPYHKLRKRHIKMMRDAISETPEAANGLVKALRQVFDWAIEDEDDDAFQINPAAKVQYFKSTTGGHHRWTEAEVEKYEKRHPPGAKAHLALSLFLYTGGRISDVARFGKQMVRDGRLHFVEFKGRDRNPKDREIPVLPVLQGAIDAAAVAGVTTGNLTFLVTEAGQPFSIKGLGNKMRDWCDLAGLPQCSAHGLRKAGATRAADNGATAHQLMAIFGWQTLKEAERYTKEADRRRHTREAMHLIAGKGTTPHA